MAHHFEPTPNKTYATKVNAIKAAEKIYGANEAHYGSAGLHYLIMTTDEGRFYPVFFGERSIQAGAHFVFNVVN